MSMALDGKTVFITGAGHGIGQSIARRMAQAGAWVVVTDISSERAEQTVGLIRDDGGKAEATTLNVCDTAEIRRVIEDTLNTHGKIDVLVNNAGGGPCGPIWKVDEKMWDATINQSLKSVFCCTRAVIDSMMQKRYGRIINIASVVGVAGKRERTAYAASKGGIIAMSKGWAMELAPYGITVNCISPGAIACYDHVNWENGCWLGRSGKPEDVSGTAVFLATEEADFITGQNIVIDGGRTLGLKGDT